jgi:Domain of unknown function (DUF4375)
MTDEVVALLRLDFVRYNVKKGGFAQLFYNTDDEFLPTYGQAIQDAEAHGFLDFYTRAMGIKNDDPEAYLEFKESHYLEDTEVKDRFLTLTFEYYGSDCDLENEIADYLSKAWPRVVTWKA